MRFDVRPAPFDPFQSHAISWANDRSPSISPHPLKLPRKSWGNDHSLSRVTTGGTAPGSAGSRYLIFESDLTPGILVENVL